LCLKEGSISVLCEGAYSPKPRGESKRMGGTSPALRPAETYSQTSRSTNLKIKWSTALGGCRKGKRRAVRKAKKLVGKKGEALFEEGSKRNKGQGEK